MKTQIRTLFTFVLGCALFLTCSKDDSSDDTVPQCASPTALTETEVNINDASIQWQDSNGTLSFEVEYGPTGFTVGSGTTVIATTTSTMLTNLMPGTTYDYYVTALCSAENISLPSNVKSFTTAAPRVSTVYLATLSEMNIFQGNLSDLNPSVYAFEYDLNTRLYTDYAKKQRLIALPEGTSMEYTGDGLPNFPDNTVIVKTFYYNLDETNLSLGRKIIETRVMIKQSGTWEFGDYIWNDAQTEATLDTVGGGTVPITFIDEEGEINNINYQIPTSTNCFTCHNNNNTTILIGPKLRSMNFNVNGTNQLQQFINAGHLTGVPSLNDIRQLPDWEDTSLTDETRVRAYFDMNCAHCHAPGGDHNVNFPLNNMDLRYETSFDDSNIYGLRESIMIRIQTSIGGYSMPLLGVTQPHAEAVDLILPYLESLE